MRTIPLTRGYVAMVDDEDYDLLSKFTWQTHINKLKCGELIYARSSVHANGAFCEMLPPELRPKPGQKQTTVIMHQLIRGKCERIDHADGNGLNNQRLNLRLASRAQNGWNRTKCPGLTSRFKGVYWKNWAKSGGKWGAYINCNKVRTHIGYFRDEWDAALAYNLKAEELFGEFAKFNAALGGACVVGP